jgi:hypothetical protein
MTHNPRCSGCPVCKPHAFPHVMAYAKGKSFSPPDPYAQGLSEMGQTIQPTPDMDPALDRNPYAPPDGYAIALAIKQIAEEEKKK